MTKNIEPTPPKQQTTIDESLRKPIEVDPISSMKMVEVGEANEGKEELIKRKKGKKADKGGFSVVFSEGKKIF